MNTKLTIKNFRVFDENGASFDVKPITILTGCNSSGKSSIVKAILLLDSFLKQIKIAKENNYPIEVDKYKLDFTSDLFRQLGNLDLVVHKDSPLNKIIIEYDVYSLMLSKNVTVQLVFATNENDKLKNGYLDSISLSTEDGEFFHSNRTNGNRFNFNLIKKDAIDFLAIDFIVHNYCNLHSSENVPKDEFEQNKENMESFLNNDCDVTRKNDIIRYTRNGYNRDSIVNRCNIKPEIVSWSINNNYSLFYIQVVEELKHISKKNIKEYVYKKYLQPSEYKILNDYSNKIIDEFINSDCATFDEFFYKYEADLLSDFPSIAPFDLKKKSFVEKLFSKTSNNIEQFANNKLFPAPDNVLKFDLLYDVIMKWDFGTYKSENNYYKFDDCMGIRTYHYMINRLIPVFVADLILEILTPEWCGNIQYASSSRTKVQRLYTFDDNNDFTKLLKNYIDSTRDFKDRTNNYHKDTNYIPDSFMNYWVKKNINGKETFELGNKIELESAGNGWGVQIKLYKTEMDKKGGLLADEGYGITSLVGILLQIETAILSAKGVHINRYYGDGLDKLDGFDSKKFYYEPQTIIIEEPEIHLHPSYQSKLADMLVDAYKKYNIHFIIETHSEYLIRRLQLLTAGIETETKLDKNDATIFYVYSREEAQKEGLPLVKRISICEDGFLDDTFGSGFFDEATNLSLKLM